MSKGDRPGEGDKAKELLGYTFERWLRDRVHEKFPGPDRSVKKSHAEKGFEYDVLAVDEHGRRILVIEAKFWDVPPSALIRDSLITHVLLGRQGLLRAVVRHCDRAKFLASNYELFRNDLKLRLPFTAYTVVPIVVTRVTPLIGKFQNVTIVETFQFLDSIGSSSAVQDK